MPNGGQKMLTLKVSKALEGRLERAARRRRIPKSDLMRTALERFLDQEAPEARSFGAEAADLAGSTSGAPDLSSNRRHLRDYGR